MKNKNRVYVASSLASVRQAMSSEGVSSSLLSMRVLLASALLVGAGLMCAAAFAQMPATQTAQGVEYVTGGFGSDESTAIKAAKAQYPVALTFAATGDDGSTPYVAEVGLEITDAQGKSVLSVPSVGPYFLAKLQPGTYTVKATYEGKTQTQEVKVAGPGSVDVRIAWKRLASGAD